MNWDRKRKIWLWFLVIVIICSSRFTNGSAGKESICSPGDIGDVGSIPGKRKWRSTPAFLLGKFHGQRGLVGYSPRGPKEPYRTEHTGTHTYWIRPKILFPSYLTSKNHEDHSLGDWMSPSPGWDQLLCSKASLIYTEIHTECCKNVLINMHISIQRSLCTKLFFLSLLRGLFSLVYPSRNLQI